MRGARLFADYTEKSFEQVLEAVPDFEVFKFWRTSDLRPGREDEEWFNVLLRKTSHFSSHLKHPNSVDLDFQPM